MDEEEEEGKEEGIEVHQKEDEQEEGETDEKEEDTTTFGTIEKRANLNAPTHPRLRSELCILGEVTN